MFVASKRARVPSKMLPDELTPQYCVTCETRYPCAHQCDHVDCRVERGEPLPEFVTAVDDNPFGETETP